MSKKAHETALPKLRFPEFRDAKAWDIKSLGSVAKLIKEKAGSKQYKLMSITSGAGLVSQMEKFGREIAGASYKNYYVIRKGDFAYNKSSTKLDPEGQIALLENEEAGAVPNSIFTCFRVNEQIVSPQFLKYPFANNIHGHWLRDLITVGARVNGALSIDSKHLLALPLALPSLPEQQKIAAALSCLDTLLTAQTAKLTALQAHKRGLMQDLFPAEGETMPKRRFPESQEAGEWTKKKLGNVLEFVMGNAFRSEEFTEIGIQLIRLGNLYQNELQLNRAPVFLPVSFKNKYSNFLVNPLDLLMSMTGTLGKRDYGFVVQVPEECSDLLLNQRVLKITPKKNYIKKFVLHQLKHEVFLEKVYSIPGGTKQSNLSIKHLSEIEILFPQIAEQQKIADCLSSLDNIITAQNQKIDALKLHKKGLMQALFPTTGEQEA